MSTETVRYDYSAVAPILPLRWTAPDVEFDKALEAMLANFVELLDKDGSPMSEQDVQDLRDEARKHHAKVRAEYVPGTKRFTDAELAAECHAATAGVYRLKVGASRGRGRPSNADVLARQSEADARTTALERMITLTRFATLPHYDEDQS